MAATSYLGSWRWLRFSLRELLGLTALSLVGLMSLMHATAWVPNLWFSVLLLSLAVAVACWRGGKSTGFAEGYVWFAGGYALLLLLSAWPQSNPFMANPNAPHSMLITHSLNDWAYDQVLPLIRKPPEMPSQSYPPPGGGGFFGPGPIGQFGGMGPGGGGMGGGFPVGNQPASGMPSGAPLPATHPLLQYPDTTSFHRVAHCMWAIVIGYAGGRFLQGLRESHQPG